MSPYFLQYTGSEGSFVFLSKMGKEKREKKNQQGGIVRWVAEVKIETT